MLALKIIQQLVYPSVFLFLTFLIGFLLILKRKKLGKYLIIFSLLFYYIFSITPVSDWIIKPLEEKYPPLTASELKSVQNIVILLGGQESDILRAAEVIKIYEAKTNKPDIYISGQDFLSLENKALKLKNHLVQSGIPEENIFLEDKSRTTEESAKNIKKILAEQSFFLVTSAYHMPRSMWVFKQNNTQPIAAPTDFKIQAEYSILDFFPRADNLKKVDLSFHEYVGFWYYKLKN